MVVVFIWISIELPMNWHLLWIYTLLIGRVYHRFCSLLLGGLNLLIIHSCWTLHFRNIVSTMFVSTATTHSMPFNIHDDHKWKEIKRKGKKTPKESTDTKTPNIFKYGKNEFRLIHIYSISNQKVTKSNKWLDTSQNWLQSKNFLTFSSRPPCVSDYQNIYW